jgi:hypothetical protein
LSGVDAERFLEYVMWLENQPISFPPVGLNACLERVKRATTALLEVPEDRSIVERFAMILSFICSDEAHNQEGISQFILRQLNENHSLNHIESLGASEALIEVPEEVDNREVNDSEEILFEEEKMES